jgi:hypothetical protein
MAIHHSARIGERQQQVGQALSRVEGQDAGYPEH